ncbi:hypothetical protein FOZ61_010017 [Perkinsus olseni]|uniref:Protein arginine methyltransferase 10 n=1 Tax=Perkinsus olseni TaxID=32597 RepID=A0A7J6KXI1_PEROL|nr:hypothetical protein FOZ61_010017 [Perkinsus olseni]
MDYIATSPSTVLELGKAGISLGRPPLPPARSTDPNWPAFDALIPALLQNPGDLGASREITLSIAGERSGLGKIVGGSNLRLYLWPLTAWRASSRAESGRRCEGWCYPAKGMRCGSLNGRCHLEAIGNDDAVVRFIFPDHGNVRYTLTIKALPLPVDEVGWFPMRLGGAELTNSDDTYPHELWATTPWWREHYSKHDAAGDHLVYLIESNPLCVAKDHSALPNSSPFTGVSLKEPTRTAKCVGVFGRFHTRTSPNNPPLSFIASLHRPYQALSSYPAITIQLPEGYTCLEVEPIPETVQFLGSSPQGRGTLADVGGTQWTYEDNVCAYTLEPDMKALSITDAANTWLAKMSIRDRNTETMEFPPFPFTDGGDMRLRNVGVMGILSDVVASPGSTQDPVDPSNSNDGEMTSFVMAFDYHLRPTLIPGHLGRQIGVANLRMSSARELLLTAPLGLSGVDERQKDSDSTAVARLWKSPMPLSLSDNHSIEGRRLTKRRHCYPGPPKVTSPEPLSDPAPYWLVRGLSRRSDTDDEDVVGWGVDFAGFNITPMSLARFHYPRVAQASTTLGVEFTTTQRLSGGGMIRVNLPPSASATCVSFIGLSLANAGNGRVICSGFGQGELRLRAAFTLALPQIPAASVVRGLIVSPEAVALSADSVASLPESVLLLGQAGDEELSGTEATATCRRQVPADLAISRVLITCPKGFRHLITTDSALSTQIQLEGFVPINGSYVVLTLTPHRYAITFPILVANTNPQVNFWRLSFCDGKSGGECQTYEDPSVITTFIFLGFDVAIGEGTTLDDGSAAAGCATVHEIIIMLLTLVSTVLQA